MTSSRRSTPNPFSFWFRVGISMHLIKRIKLFTPLDAATIARDSKLALFKPLCRVVARLVRAQNAAACADLRRLGLDVSVDASMPLLLRRYVIDVCDEARKLIREKDPDGAVMVLIPVLKPLLIDADVIAARSSPKRVHRGLQRFTTVS